MQYVYLLSFAQKRFFRLAPDKIDEVWYHHARSLIIIHLLDPISKKYNRAIIGDPLVDGEAKPQLAVKAGVWFAAIVKGSMSWSLYDCAVSPGFDFQDFEIVNETDLFKEFPDYASIIHQLTCYASIPAPSVICQLIDAWSPHACHLPKDSVKCTSF
ncbi:cupin domain-containing protein [Coxiella endosymbiont of Ornithodoros maritimus]|uniref:cupin domain-containing protein n=1 Tax=Coxiella endosymbiont of Ornithodoros maritimus TaxID=1656172 RepID=UPI0022655396|nr:cupin domain-containing protein [Coxiella endosymbiont of Ornithodoros maritimus]